MPEDSQSFRVFAYAAAGLSVAAFLLASSSARLPEASLKSLRDTAVLAVLAVIGEELSVRFADRVSLSASNLPILTAMMFLGAPQVILVAGAPGLWGSWRENSRSIVAFNAANFVLPALAGSVVFSLVKNALGVSPHHVSAGLLLGGAAAGVTYEALNITGTGIAARLKYHRSVKAFFGSEMAPFVKSLAILMGLGLMVAALYARAGIVAVVLLFIPLFAAQYMFKLLVKQRDLLQRQKELSDQYLEMNIGLAAAMVVLLDSKDEYTASHSAAVAMYCRDMAAALGLPEAETEALHLAGLLHDLGKVGTPDAVLRKEGKLDSEEWDFIKQHPSKGAEVLSHLAGYRDVADIVRYHHERLDGSGYPYGIRNGQIPEASKILAVADTYHAMTSDRPYRAARSSFDALKELRRMSGITLDGRYVEVLASILRDKDLSYRDGTSTDFMGEYERGRINLRLRGEALAQVSETLRSRHGPVAG